MFKINQGSDRLIIVIHEIYGVNQHIMNSCHSLAVEGFDILCPNLLEQELPFDYAEEKKAYHYFMNKIGFTTGVKQVKKVLRDHQKNYSKIYIVGFSVGATIAWLCSDEPDVNGVVGFYGSRIRDYVKLEPSCPVLLFFPAHEPSFSVAELVTTLEKKSIDVKVFDAHHGFSDPYASAFNEEIALDAYRDMLKFLNQQKNRTEL